MTDDQEKMIDKVQKLLAKAESTTPEEAEALMEKASELMMRYAIDDAMLAASGAREDKIVVRRIKLESSKYSKARMNLGFEVGKAFKFRLLQSDHTVVWVGWESDVDKAEIVFASLSIQQERATAAFYRERIRTDAWMDAKDRFIAKRSFMYGFAWSAGEKLAEARQHQVDLSGTSDGNSMALVLVSREKQVDAFYDENYGDAKASKSRGLEYDPGALRSGRAAGASADVGSPGIRGTKGALKS